MAKNGFKIFDSDMHIMEPPDLWQRYIDDEFKSRAPVGVTSDNVRELRTTWPEDGDQQRGGGIQYGGHTYDRLQEIYRSDAARGWSSQVQLEAATAFRKTTDVFANWSRLGVKSTAELNTPT